MILVPTNGLEQHLGKYCSGPSDGLNALLAHPRRGAGLVLLVWAVSWDARPLPARPGPREPQEPPSLQDIAGLQERVSPRILTMLKGPQSACGF